MKQFQCDDDSTVVQTPLGKMRGYYYDGVYAFKGIPYAQANRFQMPKPAQPWDGILDATSYGFVCPLLAEAAPMSEAMIPHMYWPHDEHCQNLNVWTTSIDGKNRKKPVIVWIHGGGFSDGSAIEQLAYDGTAAAKHGDCVLVSVNHRPNILGYLDLSPFGSKYANSGNAGQADLVEALRWIQGNIESFGGDPGNVTLIGQSGGGGKITSLMQTPDADGLFHKGIIMSGILTDDILAPKNGNGEKLVKAMLDKLGIKESDIEKLETIPYEHLANAYKQVAPALQQTGEYVGCAPLPNDWYLGEPQQAGFTDHAKTIPLIVGTVFGEFAFEPTGYNKYTMSDDEMRKHVTDLYGKDEGKVEKLFAKAWPGKKLVDVLSLDTFFRPATKSFIQEKSKYGESATYSYVFGFEFPYQFGKPAWHCSDIPFVLHNCRLVPSTGVPGVTDKLQEQIFGAVAAFAHTGDPNHAEIPFWPASLPGEEATMIFDRTCEVRRNFDNELVKFAAARAPKPSFAAPQADDEKRDANH